MIIFTIKIVFTTFYHLPVHLDTLSLQRMRICITQLCGISPRLLQISVIIRYYFLQSLLHLDTSHWWRVVGKYFGSLTLKLKIEKIL